MIQLELFDNLSRKIEDGVEFNDLENVSIAEVVKYLNTLKGVDDIFIPEYYRVYKTGGKHPWGEKNPELFGGSDWPFVFNAKTKKISGYNVVNGYILCVAQSKQKGTKVWSCLMHRLVCGAFIKNPFNKPFVDHIDGNVANFKVTNLRWTTRSENRINEIATKNMKNKISMEEKYHMYEDKIKKRMHNERSH